MYYRDRGVYEDENISWCVYSQYQANIPPDLNVATGIKIGLFHGPIKHGGVPPIVNPTLIYKEAQKVDEWYGENYEGTSVRGGAKYLKSTNKISSYLWTYNINVLINTVLTQGPVVVGTYWYTSMFKPDRNGLIRATGRIAGGHAYVINGVDKTKKLFRIKNSWGKNWGKSGHAFISFSDMEKLIKQYGEVCLAIENKF